jgi:tungstate transport system substrate-binding protein
MFSLKMGLKRGSVALALVLASSAGAAELMMATTTSTDDTGLLDYLAPEFQKDTNIELKWTAVGTGKALKLGENCDASVVLVHAPAQEIEYVKKGFGVEHTPVMYNDFVVIGAPKYKAKLAGKNAAEAFKIIESEKIPFISRGDKSGTHSKERSVWTKAVGAVPEKQPWYFEGGQGMLATINIAEERDGLTLTDRGTYIKYEANHKGNAPLVIVLEGDENLKNFYSVMAVNPANCPKTDLEGARAFTKWLTDDKGQKLIGDYKLMGKQMFTPDAKSRKE